MGKENIAIDGKDAELNALVQQVHQEINQYRYSRNLPSLSLDDRISQQARIHSQDMAQQRVDFSHNGFEDRVAALENKIDYSSAAENVGYNQGYSSPAGRVVKGWIASEGHRKNALGNYNLTGIGIAKNQRGEYYFTQIFIQQR